LKKAIKYIRYLLKFVPVEEYIKGEKLIREIEGFVKGEK